MPLSNVAYHSASVSTLAAGRPLPGAPLEANRLETVQDVQNKANNGCHRLVVLARDAMPAIKHVASGLLWTLLPLTSAYDSDDGGEAEVTDFVLMGGGEMAARSYEAAQLLRHSPVFWTTALITTTLTIGGVVLRLRHSSPSMGSPTAEAQYSLGPTVMSACANLADEIPDADGVTLASPTMDDLQQLEPGANDLVAMVELEIRNGTQAPSLEQLRQCITSDLKGGKLWPLRGKLFDLGLQLTPLMQVGRTWTGNRLDELEVARKNVADRIAVLEGINAKLTQAVALLTTEIDRQRARPAPRIG